MTALANKMYLILDQRSIIDLIFEKLTHYESVKVLLLVNKYFNITFAQFFNFTILNYDDVWQYPRKFNSLELDANFPWRELGKWRPLEVVCRLDQLPTNNYIIKYTQKCICNWCKSHTFKRMDYLQEICLFDLDIEQDFSEIFPSLRRVSLTNFQDVKCLSEDNYLESVLLCCCNLKLTNLSGILKNVKKLQIHNCDNFELYDSLNNLKYFTASTIYFNNYTHIPNITHLELFVDTFDAIEQLLNECNKLEIVKILADEIHCDEWPNTQCPNLKSLFLSATSNNCEDYSNLFKCAPHLHSLYIYITSRPQYEITNILLSDAHISLKTLKLIAYPHWTIQYTIRGELKCDELESLVPIQATQIVADVCTINISYGGMHNVVSNEATVYSAHGDNHISMFALKFTTVKLMFNNCVTQTTSEAVEQVILDGSNYTFDVSYFPNLNRIVLISESVKIKWDERPLTLLCNKKEINIPSHIKVNIELNDDFDYLN